MSERIIPQRELRNHIAFGRAQTAIRTRLQASATAAGRRALAAADLT